MDPEKLATVFERVAAVLAKVNATLSLLGAQGLRHYEHSTKSDERREREYEVLRREIGDLGRAIALLGSQVTEARKDIDEITDPNIQLPRPALMKKEEDALINQKGFLTPWAAVPVILKWALIVAATAGGWVHSLWTSAHGR